MSMDCIFCSYSWGLQSCPWTMPKIDWQSLSMSIQKTHILSAGLANVYTIPIINLSINNYLFANMNIQIGFLQVLCYNTQVK